MYNAKLNVVRIGGVVTKVDIKPSNNPKNPNIPEYFGSIDVVVDLGYFDKDNNNQWVEQVNFYTVTLNSKMCNKFKEGLNIGDYIELKGLFIDQENHMYTKVMMIELLSHTHKAIIDLVKAGVNGVNGASLTIRKPRYAHAYLAGNISNVNIFQSKKANSDGINELYGSVSLALDNSTPKEGGGFNERTAFAECKLTHNTINRVKSGFKLGDQATFSGDLIQETWKEAGTDKTRSKLKLKVRNVHQHLDKGVKELAKQHGFYGEYNQPQAQAPAQQPAQQQGGGFQPAAQAPAQQPAQQQSGGFQPAAPAPAQQPAQQQSGGFQPAAPAPAQQPAQQQGGGFQQATGFNQQSAQQPVVAGGFKSKY